MASVLGGVPAVGSVPVVGFVPATGFVGEVAVGSGVTLPVGSVAVVLVEVAVGSVLVVGSVVVGSGPGTAPWTVGSPPLVVGSVEVAVVVVGSVVRRA